MKRAFTVTELLVITAIIAILATILFPIFSRERESNNAQCLHNLRKIGQAIFMYAQNSDEVIVPWLECSGTSPNCGGAPTIPAFRQWTARLMPYAKGMSDGDGDEGGHPPRPFDELDLYPPQGIFKCPDWTFANLEKGSDQADCDGDGTAGSGIQGAGLGTIDTGLQGRQLLFATYGLVFDMCSPIEADAGRPECSVNGGGSSSVFDYGRDGSTVDQSVFAYAGSRLYPGVHGLDRRFYEISRDNQTILAGDGGIWRSSGFWATVVGCESRYIHGSGANFLMADGHSMPLAGNAERIRELGDDGKWMETYFTFYE